MPGHTTERTVLLNWSGESEEVKSEESMSSNLFFRIRSVPVHRTITCLHPMLSLKQMKLTFVPQSLSLSPVCCYSGDVASNNSLEPKDDPVKYTTSRAHTYWKVSGTVTHICIYNVYIFTCDGTFGMKQHILHQLQSMSLLFDSHEMLIVNMYLSMISSSASLRARKIDSLYLL